MWNRLQTSWLGNESGYIAHRKNEEYAEKDFSSNGRTIVDQAAKCIFKRVQRTIAYDAFLRGFVYLYAFSRKTAGIA